MADYWMGDEDNDFNYESEYHKLKESTSLLELALLKLNIDASNIDGDDNRLGVATG
jgi:hypothetical protein